LWGLEGGPSIDVTPRVRRRRWLVRNLAPPSRLLFSHRPPWWPFRRIYYWSLLEPERSGLWDLVSRSTKLSWSGEMSGVHAPGLRDRVLRLAALTLAFVMCLVPRRFQGDPTGQGYG